MTRRWFLKMGIFFGLWFGLPKFAISDNSLEKRREKFILLAEGLLSDWCQGFLRYQINKPIEKSRHGALWSPGDYSVLGRGADAAVDVAHRAQSSTVRVSHRSRSHRSNGASSNRGSRSARCCARGKLATVPGTWAQTRGFGDPRYLVGTLVAWHRCSAAPTCSYLLKRAWYAASRHRCFLSRGREPQRAEEMPG